MARSTVCACRCAPWHAACQQELLSFPVGKHDDQVDALGLVGQLMDKFVPGFVPKKPDTEKWQGYAPTEKGDLGFSIKML
jgi:hypothetical protein